MALFVTLFVTCVLVSYIQPVTAKEGGSRVPGGPPIGPGGPTGLGGTATTIQCDNMQNATCPSMSLTKTMMIVYTNCTHSPGSVQVTFHCCIPGLGSSDECSSHLKETRNCTSGLFPQLVCEVMRDGQTEVTTSTQTVTPRNAASHTTQQPAGSGSHSASRKKDVSNSISGVTIGLIAGLAGAVVFAVIVILVVFKVCRQKRLVTEDAEKTIPAGFGSKEWEVAKSKPYGDIGDDGYMDIKALDREKEKPQDN